MDQWFPAGDGQKFAIFIIVIAAFYSLARLISSHSIILPPPAPSDPEPLPAVAPIAPPPVERPDVVKVVPSSRNLTVSLSDMWFDDFDVAAGPPDPRCFCSEMTVTVTISDYNLREYESTYLIATPEGMRVKMRQENWSSMFLPSLLVVDHYDIDVICEAILEQIRAEDPDAAPPSDNENLDTVGS